MIYTECNNKQHTCNGCTQPIISGVVPSSNISVANHIDAYCSNIMLTGYLDTTKRS